MSDAICSKYGCDYQLDLDGQVTCTNCGAMDDDMQSIPLDMPNPQPELNEAGYSTGKWSDDDDMGITPFLGPNR